MQMYIKNDYKTIFCGYFFIEKCILTFYIIVFGFFYKCYTNDFFDLEIMLIKNKLLFSNNINLVD
ncbi:hypothetical protein CAPN002_24870 [Capnocytophaga stomatis]|nr:hypothetical protein CAPN002_24870 [Capnocytophaga stomatis]